MRLATPLLSYLIFCLIACGPPVSEDPEILASLPDEVDFNFHIKPILSDRCFSCHGPDANKREAGLRLDMPEGAFAALKESPGKVAIDPGSLNGSEVYHRITTDDPDLLMPPPEAKLELSAYEVALINKWIDQGGEWKPHWAFLPPQKPKPPTVKQKSWVQNPVDQFVLAELQRKGLEPTKAASKERLLRRVSMDLTGLPPTLEELDAFLADESADAYEKVVDRLLSNPAYGERMAVDWLDVARYADSHGLHADGSRNMWPWRDWVIQAFNENLPYNDFIIWQMAGDMLPNPTDEQVIATAFHRNHPMTAEGGVVDEEWRLEYVFDRSNTTAKAFMGMTMECARCHDHKFDPISQKEFYQMAAFFNNVKEVGMTGDDGDFGPVMWLPEQDEKQQLADLDGQIEAQQQRLKAAEKEILAAKSYLQALPKLTAGVQKGITAHYPMEKVVGKNRLDGKKEASLGKEANFVPGKIGKALQIENEYQIPHLQAKNRQWTDPFSTGLWIHPTQSDVFQTLMGTAGNKNQKWRGWDLFLNEENQLSFRLIHCLPQDYLEVTTKTSIPQDGWSHVFMTYDGLGKAAGVRLYVDGKEVATTVGYDRLNEGIQTYDFGQEDTINRRPIRVGKSYRAFTGDNGLFQGMVDDLQLYERQLSGLEVAAIAGSPVPMPAVEVVDPETEALLQDHALIVGSAETRSARKALKELQDQRIKLLMGVKELMVMEEMAEARPMHVLDRGVYDSPLEEVFPGVPSSLGSFPEDLPKNRLGLAQWLTRPDHPLTSRVTVNRYWQLFFGQGLVNTPDDFGNQGSLPTHPGLLDWLSVQFMESGWDVKALNKLIVMSATYQQDSYTSPELQELDPQNQWLARGPKHRLSAEMIRDHALASSGLLVSKIGGPSAKPYQPDSLWIELGNFSADLLYYVPDTAEGLYRRSLYTFIRRTAPPPSMLIFDGSTRNTCVVSRQNTNTPLQALVLLNDPQYVEAARKLAERMQKEGGESLEDQIAFAFRLLTSRFPTQEETKLFKALYEQEKQSLEAAPDRAKELLTVGESQADPNLPPLETASLAMLASTMLNFDESYTKR